jgi:NADH-quinone oxidoreductase subunit M
VLEDVQIKETILLLISLEFLLFLVFSVSDILLFYIFFEAVLIPMYLLIGLGGSGSRKVRAVNLFMFFTLIGSFCFLIGIIYIYTVVGSLYLENIYFYSFNSIEQYWLWLAFFLSFASKIPVFPLHIWLPEAHVEAPTVGSVLLAGILLKLGVYGFLRFSILIFPAASLFFSPFVYVLGILGIIFGSLNALRQTDLKRIVAYSSVAHMNLIIIGIFSFNILGLEGSVFQSLSHGFVSGAMFLLVGILYDRYHSRLLYYYGGLVHFMPIYAFFLMLFTMSNIALPGTISFVGEFLLLIGIYQNNILGCILSTTGVVLCGGYSLWLYNRIIYGNLKISNILYFKDLSFREFSVLLFLLIFVLAMGVYPKPLLNFLCIPVTGMYMSYLL